MDDCIVHMPPSATVPKPSATRMWTTWKSTARPSTATRPWGVNGQVTAKVRGGQRMLDSSYGVTAREGR